MPLPIKILLIVIAVLLVLLVVLYIFGRKAEKKADSLKIWLSNALCYLPFETPRVHISFRKSTTADVDENVISKEWCVEKVTYSPDKKAIKTALESGETIEGAVLTEHQNIQIK